MEEVVEAPRKFKESDIKNCKMTLPKIIEHLKREKPLYYEEYLSKYEALQELLPKIDAPVASSSRVSENKTSAPPPKRRKKSKVKSEEQEKTKVNLEEVRSQMEIIKQALNVIYDLENLSFKTILLKNRSTEVSSVPFLKRLKEHGQALPLFIDLDGKEAPPLCGSIRAEDTYVASVGDMVVALLNKDNCILAEVLSYDPEKDEYTVDDIYEKQNTEQTINRKKVIPLPRMRADPSWNPEALFQLKDIVLALYPGTTCFYPAMVEHVPRDPEEPYHLLFEDDDFKIHVHQCFVIHYDAEAIAAEY